MAERIGWEQFLRKFKSRWEQGEHVFINGQTGSGKTDILMRIMELRTHSVLMVTKPRDPIFRSELVRHYAKQNVFAPTPGTPRILLSAKNGRTTQEQVANQQVIFAHALDSIYMDKGWTVGVDETLWFTQELKLGNHIGRGSFMGRALGLSFISATQRPAHIPVIIPQSASHAFIGQTGRKGDLATLAELGGDTRATMAAIQSLNSKHDFVYVDTNGKLPLYIVNTHE